MSGKNLGSSFGIVRSRYAACAAITVILALVGTPDANSQDSILQPVKFSESLRSQAPVSGEVFRGLLSVPASPRLSLEHINAILPAAPGGRLCVVVESKDARYYAESEYEVPARAEPQRVYLRIPTRYNDLLTTYLVSSISMAAFLDTACRLGDSGVRIYLPLQLERNAAAKPKMMMWLSSGGPTIDTRIFDRRSAKYYSCRRGESVERGVAFDRECELPEMQGGGFVEFVIVRNRFENRLDDIVVRAYLP